MPAATSNRGGRGGPPGNRGRGGIGTTTPRRPIPEYKDGLDPTAVQILDMPKDLPGAQVQITDLVYIGSYNWINDNQRTIVVPGEEPSPSSQPNLLSTDRLIPLTKVHLQSG